MRKRIDIFFDITFAKFVIVGIVNTLFGSAIMFACYNLLHLGYWISSMANYLLGSILSYFLNKYFTFKNKEKNARMVIRFIINIVVCYILAYGVMKEFVRMLLSDKSIAIQDNIAMFMGMGVFVILNYLGQRFWAFKKEEAE